MAVCTINSAYLVAPSRNNVYMQKASIGYYASATLPDTTYSEETEGTVSYPQTGTYSGGGETDLTLTITYIGYQSKTRTKFEYSDLEYDWAFNSSFTATGSTGTINYITGLTQGAKNFISATVTVTCTETTTVQAATRNWTKIESYSRTSTDVDFTFVGSSESPGSYGSWSDNETSSIDTTGACEATQATNTLSVYTRPGAFSDYNFAVNTTIESSAGLTAGKVDNWIAHCNAFNNWYNQPSIAANESNIGATCAVTTGDYITASWYNNCVAAIADTSVRPSTVTGGPNGTIITASVIAALGTAISIEDPS